jgi:hypothetical protein
MPPQKRTNFSFNPPKVIPNGFRQPKTRTVKKRHF